MANAFFVRWHCAESHSDALMFGNKMDALQRVNGGDGGETGRNLAFLHFLIALVLMEHKIQPSCIKYESLAMETGDCRQVT